MSSDLHMHTNFSDGSFSPEELINASKEIGLKYISITDHDTVDGIIHLYENGLYPNKGLKIIPGIEFSAKNPEHDIHLVGYNIDIYDGDLQDKLNYVIEGRWVRFTNILQRLQELGLQIKESDVLKIADTSKSIGRAHIARTLVRNGYFKTIREAFEQMLQKGKPAYVPRYLLEIDEIIELIHNAGGQVALAHPKLIADDNLVEDICANHNIDAIEIFYPIHSPEDIQRYKIFAEKYNLLITGGSDFHGTNSRYVKNLGEFTIEDEFAEKFFKP